MAERVAIVGSGLGGFVAYATLRHAGLRPEEIAVFGGDSDPAGAWRPRAAAIRQRLMRSESDGHCAPPRSRGSPSARRRGGATRRRWCGASSTATGRPSTSSSATSRELRERSRWDESFVPARVDRITAVDGGFEVGGRGVFRHVLVATGHPGLAVPDELKGDHGSSTPTSRTSTPRASPSSAPAWRRRPNG